MTKAVQFIVIIFGGTLISACYYFGFNLTGWHITFPEAMGITAFHYASMCIWREFEIEEKKGPKQ